MRPGRWQEALTCSELTRGAGSSPSHPRQAAPHTASGGLQPASSPDLPSSAGLQIHNSRSTRQGPPPGAERAGPDGRQGHRAAPPGPDGMPLGTTGGRELRTSPQLPKNTCVQADGATSSGHPLSPHMYYLMYGTRRLLACAHVHGSGAFDGPGRAPRVLHRHSTRLPWRQILVWGRG